MSLKTPKKSGFCRSCLDLRKQKSLFLCDGHLGDAPARAARFRGTLAIAVLMRGCLETGHVT